MHKLTEKGKKTLRQVAKWAAMHDEQFDMEEVFDNLDEFPAKKPTCETAACLAGWTAHKTLTSRQRLKIVNQDMPQTLMMLIAHLKLCGKFDPELSLLFNLVGDVDSSNVVVVVDTFIEGGIEPVLELLDLSAEDYRHLANWEEDIQELIPTAQAILNMEQHA